MKCIIETRPKTHRKIRNAKRQNVRIGTTMVPPHYSLLVVSRAQEEDESLCSNWDCCGKHRDRENGCWGYSEILRTPFDRSPRKGGSQKGVLQPRFPGGDMFFEYFLWRAPKPRFDPSVPKNLSSFVRIHHRKGIARKTVSGIPGYDHPQHVRLRRNSNSNDDDFLLTIF